MPLVVSSSSCSLLQARSSLRGHDLSLTDYLHRNFNFSSVTFLETVEERNRRPHQPTQWHTFDERALRNLSLGRNLVEEGDSQLQIITDRPFFFCTLQRILPFAAHSCESSNERFAIRVIRWLEKLVPRLYVEKPVFNPDQELVMIVTY